MPRVDASKIPRHTQNENITNIFVTKFWIKNANTAEVVDELK